MASQWNTSATQRFSCDRVCTGRCCLISFAHFHLVQRQRTWNDNYRNNSCSQTSGVGLPFVGHLKQVTICVRWTGRARPSATSGFPLEALVRDKSGQDELRKKKLQKELADINKEARKLKTRLKAIERRRAELMKELDE